MRRLAMFVCVGLAATLAAPAGAVELAGPLKRLQAVGPHGQGHREATAAWAEVVRADAAELPTILTALDGANPLAANWIRTAVETIAQRELAHGGRLPAPQLEAFVLDRGHAPQARRLAYEWLLHVDPKAEDRLVPGMIDDPSLELRRDAVARLMSQSESLADAGNKAEAAATCRRAMTAARDIDQIRDLAKQLRKLGQPVDIAVHMGFLLHWHAVGPFDNTDEKGFDVAYAPEREIRLDASYPGKHKPVGWVDHQSTDEWGIVDFNKILGEEKLVVGYATTELDSPKARTAQFRITSYNAVKVWLNGRLIDQHKVYHSGSQLDQYVCRADLQPGRNVILLKVCQNKILQDWARNWQFQLRVCDERGTAVRSGK